MHARLNELRASFEAATERLHRIAGSSTEEAWSRRPEGGGWSAAECVAHLNLTSEAYVPLLREALDRARAVGGDTPDRLRRDLVGWLLWRTVRPEGRMKAKTAPAFVPTSDASRASLLETFERLQRVQVEAVEEADGLPIHRVKMASPFNERVKYSLYSALTILPAHQHRHLGQAERALARR